MTITQATVAHRTVSANGLRFHVVEAGTSGPPVLLLHGFPQHSYAWRHVITDLARDHRVFALDLRGAGSSDAPRSGYDTASLVSDVLAVVEAIGLAEIRLVGHQWGGWLGFHLALAAPERFCCLVAVNSPHPWLRHRRLLPRLWRFWYTALFEYPVVGAWLIRSRPRLIRWLLRRGRPELPEADADVFVGALRQPARARAGQQWLWQLVLHDIPARLLGRYRHRQLTVPTVLLAGTHDFLLPPACFRGDSARGHGPEVAVVEGGHYLPEERPDAIASAVRRTWPQIGSRGK